MFSLLRQNQWEEPRFEYSWNKSLALHSTISLDFVNTITLLSLHIPAGIISWHQLFYQLLFGIILNQAIRTCLPPHSLKKPKNSVVFYEGQVLEFQIESVYPYKYLPRSWWPIRWKMLKLTELLQPITHKGMLWITAPPYAWTFHSPDIHTHYWITGRWLPGQSPNPSMFMDPYRQLRYTPAISLFHHHFKLLEALNWF